MPRSTNMKAMKAIASLLGFFVIIGLVSANTNHTFRVSKAKSIVEGYYAKASPSANLNDNILFELEENDAPYDENNLSIKYKPETKESLKVLKDNGTISYLPDEYIGTVDALIKCNATQYLIPKEIFNGIDGGINVGDTIMIDGNFIYDDCVLHIKQSKLYVYTQNALVTIPQNVNNITSYLDGVRPSKDVQEGHDWAFLIWPNALPFEEMLRTGEDGYYPTSIHNVYVDGVAHANCLYDALRRRDEWGTEIYICAESQLGTSNPTVGTVVVIDGVFNYKNYIDNQHEENPVLDLEPGESFGIEINLLALLKVGGNTDDYEQIDLKSYLLEQFGLLYNSDLYEPDLYQDIVDIQTKLTADIELVNTARDIYAIYNNAVSLMEEMEISEDGLLIFKERYIDEIQSYVDLEKYEEQDALTIQGFINTCLSRINSSTTTKEVVSAVQIAKSNIDSIRTRLSKMEEAILELSPGYQDYLAPFDYVTLNDLSLGDSLTFHGHISERENDINTNDDERNQFNIFPTSSNNTNGNVVFNFKYRADAIPTGESNVIIVLRGIRYYGYKFGFGNNSQGFTFKRTTGGGDDSFVGKENIFTNTQSEYRISVSAIDLIEGNRTWIRIQINGFEYLNTIVDSLPFCNNARVSLSNNDNQYSDVDGTATISNYYPSSAISNLDPIYCGRFEYDDKSSVSDGSLHLTLDENDLIYDASVGIDSYPLKQSNIKLIRNNTEYELADSSVPAIGKYSPTSYRLYLKSLVNENIGNIVDGDKIVISGLFVYFDSTTLQKTAFEIGTSTFVYHSSNSSWTTEVSINDARTDALRRLDYYSSNQFLERYEEIDQLEIVSIINDAKNQINNASSIAEISTIQNNALNRINNIKTSLKKYQESAIELLSLYKEDEYSNYREEELNDILSIKESAYKNINSVSNKEEVDSIYLEATMKIDAVLTNQELLVIELKENKTQGINEIKNRYAMLIDRTIGEDKLNKLNAETLDAIEKIKRASSVTEVEKIVKDYLNAHPLRTNSNNLAAIIVISSISGVILIAGLITLLILKKKGKLIRRKQNQ